MTLAVDALRVGGLRAFSAGTKRPMGRTGARQPVIRRRPSRWLRAGQPDGAGPIGIHVSSPHVRPGRSPTRICRSIPLQPPIRGFISARRRTRYRTLRTTTKARHRPVHSAPRNRTHRSGRPREARWLDHRRRGPTTHTGRRDETDKLAAHWMLPSAIAPAPGRISQQWSPALQRPWGCAPL